MLWHGNECGQNKSNEIFKTIMIGQKQLENVDCFKTFHPRGIYCIYSAASQATSPDGVYILCDFHKVVKWPGTVDFKF
jgi:hypothetical protein